MIVIDVSLNMLQAIDRQHFYLIKGNIMEVYSTMNGMLFRHIRTMGSPSEEVIFAEKYLTDSVRAERVSHINESKYQAMLLHYSEQLTAIKEQLEKLNKVLQFESNTL